MHVILALFMPVTAPKHTLSHFRKWVVLVGKQNYDVVTFCLPDYSRVKMEG